MRPCLSFGTPSAMDRLTEKALRFGIARPRRPLSPNGRAIAKRATSERIWGVYRSVRRLRAVSNDFRRRLTAVSEGARRGKPPASRQRGAADPPSRHHPHNRQTLHP